MGAENKRTDKKYPRDGVCGRCLGGGGGGVLGSGVAAASLWLAPLPPALQGHASDAGRAQYAETPASVLPAACRNACVVTSHKMRRCHRCQSSAVTSTSPDGCCLHTAPPSFSLALSANNCCHHLKCRKHPPDTAHFLLLVGTAAMSLRGEVLVRAASFLRAAYEDVIIFGFPFQSGGILITATLASIRHAVA